MMAWMRGTVSTAAFSVMALALVACTDTGSQRFSQNNLPQPQSLQPVQNSQVSSTALPPLASTGTQPSAAQIAPGLTGTPVLGGAPAPSATTDMYGNPVPNGTTLGSQPTNLGAQGGNSSFVSLNAADGMSAAGPRDFSTGVSIDKLLGGWNVTSGASSCRLNLTQTAKDGTSRYRASAPACSIPNLGGVASWALVGSGIQLFDEAGSIIGALQLSGNRFIGTVAGGAPLSMSS